MVYVLKKNPEGHAFWVVFENSRCQTIPGVTSARGHASGWEGTVRVICEIASATCLLRRLHACMYVDHVLGGDLATGDSHWITLGVAGHLQSAAANSQAMRIL